MLNPKTVEEIYKISKIQNKSRSEIVDKLLLQYVRDFNGDLEGQQKIW